MSESTLLEPARLFYSYAREDKPLLDELNKHLSVLLREELIAPWHDRDIQVGSERGKEIDEHLDTAEIILLLISPDFLASDYCYDHEMQRAIERHRRKEVCVIPVILRPCDWQNAHFGALQAAPRNGQPITTWSNRDEAFLEIVQSLRALIKQLRRRSRSPLSHSVSAKNRKAMLSRLQSMYQELLAESLQETAWIDLGLTEVPGDVQNATNLILHRAKRPKRPLPSGTSVLQVYQEANQELLILGAPGAGKSTLLYQLGRDLLTRATEQSTAPLPVLFPLSTWAEKHLPLGDWMAEQLVSPLYLVRREQSQQWVGDEQILPLLDGLDEMQEEARPACIAAINAYRSEHPLCSLVVCSRSAEYEAASMQQQGRLHLQSAIEVQPLSQAQLDAALVQAGQPITALRSELKRNTELRELAKTPLWLNVLLLTFKNTPVRALSRRRTVLQKQLCERYVQRMVEEKGQGELYPLEQTQRWLSWLAGRMRERDQTTFAVELLQSNWLRGRTAVFFYRLSVWLVIWLVAGPIWGLSAWSAYGQNMGLLGLVIGQLDGLLEMSRKVIKLPERFIWSWKGARSGLVAGLVLGPIVGLFLGWLFGAGVGWAIGLILVPVSGLGIGLNPNQYAERSTLAPGEGFRRSLKAGLVVGLVFALYTGPFFALVSWLPSKSIVKLLIGLVSGLFCGLLFGLRVIIHHLILRFWLWRAGLFPLRASTFLEDARARHLLQRIGGSYHFVHRLLLDYFADLDGAK